MFFSQEKPIVYVNNAKAYHNKDYSWFSNERSFCDLTILPDSTFSFYSRPYTSCSTWNEIKGKWKKENNTYTFLSQYEVSENDTRFIFSNDLTKKYLLKFKTDKNSELKNRSIKIDYWYDYDAKIDHVEKTMNFNEDNSIEIPFKEIPNHKKLASIRIEYYLSANEKRYAYITEGNIANVKEKDIPNIVEIEFVEQPIKEIVYRTTIGKLDGEKLEIISSSKTKISLPDYLKEIDFEKYYELRK
jgi:transposase-like protein